MNEFEFNHCLVKWDDKEENIFFKIFHGEEIKYAGTIREDGKMILDKAYITQDFLGEEAFTQIINKIKTQVGIE